MAATAKSADARQSLQGRQFELFHYRDKEPDSRELHYHDFYEVYLFLRGSVDYSVEGRHYTLQSGDIMLISPLELHQVQVEESQPYERMVLWMSGECLTGLAGGGPGLTACFDRSRPGHSNLLRLPMHQQMPMRELLEDIDRELNSGEYGHELAARASLTRLMVELNRLALRQEVPLRSSTVVEKVTAYIDRHYCDPLSLEELAGIFFISKYYLSHQFRRQMGISVYRYITKKRLAFARQMLVGGVNPTDAYRCCGFGDYANFYRAFRSEYGISPGEAFGGTAQDRRRSRERQTDGEAAKGMIDNRDLNCI